MKLDRMGQTRQERRREDFGVATERNTEDWEKLEPTQKRLKKEQES